MTNLSLTEEGPLSSGRDAGNDHREEDHHCHHRCDAHCHLWGDNFRVTSIYQEIMLAPRTCLVSTLWVNNKGCQRQDADDEGGHDVVERVELRLAAQHQRVFDVGEVLQHLQEIKSTLFLVSS